MSILQLPLTIDDLELAWLKEDYAEGWGKTGKAIVQRNLSGNPNFEINLNNTGTVQTCTRTRDTVEFYSGVASMKCVTGGAISDGAVMSTFLNTGHSKNKTFRAAARVKGTVGETVDILIVKRYDDLTFGVVTTQFTFTGGWDFVPTGALTLIKDPDNTSSLSMQVRARTASVVTFYVDSVIIVEGSDIPQYFDGSTSSDNIFEYSWEGAVNNSSSLKVSKNGKPILFTNLFPNPNCINDDIASMPALRGVASYEVNNPITGSKSWRIDSTGAAGSGCSMTIGLNGIYGNMFTCSPGEIVYVGANIRTLPGQYGRIELQFLDGANTSLGAFAASNPNPGTTQFTVASATAPVNTVKIAVILRFSDAPTFATNAVGVIGVFDNLQIAKVAFTKRIDSGDRAWTGNQYTSSYVAFDTRGSIADFEFSYWAKRSGLTPMEQWTLADHKMTALAALGFNSGTIGERWVSWMRSLVPGAVSMADTEMAFYKSQLGL